MASTLYYQPVKGHIENAIEWVNQNDLADYVVNVTQGYQNHWIVIYRLPAGYAQSRKAAANG